MLSLYKLNMVLIVMMAELAACYLCIMGCGKGMLSSLQPDNFNVVRKKS
jgi:hypothetical protein